LPAGRKLAALRGDGFRLVDQFLFVLQQCLARIAIGLTFIRIAGFGHNCLRLCAIAYRHNRAAM
jgi:hypothetical protein